MEYAASFIIGFAAIALYHIFATKHYERRLSELRQQIKNLLTESKEEQQRWKS